MEKRWNILQAESMSVHSLIQSLKIHPVLCKILVQRGLDSFEKTKQFFRPSLDELHDPFLMKDMEKATERIFQAFRNKEKILVFGDYDVDGTTSVACMYRFLQKIYLADHIDYYIPHRYREGY